MKAQRPKKEGKRKKKVKKEEEPDLGHEQDLHHPRSRSFERKPRNPKNGVDSL